MYAPMKLMFQLTFLVFLLTTGNCTKSEDGGDNEFKSFLRNAMMNYPKWLEENHHDPSPSTSVVMTGTSNGVNLDCLIIKHSMTGHSKNESNTMNALSNFTLHNFQVLREILSSVDFQGEFNCTGRLSTLFFPELSNDLRFSGQGNFFITTNQFRESLTMQNVGITPDYKLNMYYSWTEYTLFTEQKSFAVSGEWNETLIKGEYLDDVQKGFANIYKVYPYLYDEQITYPSGLLLKRYIDQVAASVNLADILDTEDLPSLYIPTPSPDTTTTPKTPEKENAGMKTAAGLAFLYVGVFSYLVNLLYM